MPERYIIYRPGPVVNEGPVSKIAFGATRPLEKYEDASLVQLEVDREIRGFTGINDFSREGLPTKNREIIRQLYQNLIKALPLVGFDENDIKYATGLNGSRTLHFIGVPGEYRIWINDERDKDRNIQTKKSIQIEKRTEDKKGYFSSETVVLNNDGTGFYSNGYWGNDKSQRGVISESSEENSELYIHKSAELLETLLDSINNPEYSIPAISQKLIGIRVSLMDYFRQMGVVPMMDREILHYKPGRLGELVEMATGEKQEERDYEIELGHWYQRMEFSGLEGRWDVKFDVDQENKLMRARGRRTEVEAGHGLGIIMRRKGIWDMDQRTQSPETRYEIWENGDASSPGGILSRFVYSSQEPYFHDSQQLLIDFLKLESSLTGKPLPPELAPPQSKGILSRLFKRS